MQKLLLVHLPLPSIKRMKHGMIHMLAINKFNAMQQTVAKSMQMNVGKIISKLTIAIVVLNAIE